MAAASAFKGSVMPSRHRPSSVSLNAAAKKKTAETFKKSDFVASVSEKTGMSKVASEQALNAVLETITEVSLFVPYFVVDTILRLIPSPLCAHA